MHMIRENSNEGCMVLYFQYKDDEIMKVKLAKRLKLLIKRLKLLIIKAFPER